MRKARSRIRIKRYSIYLSFIIVASVAYDICFGYTLKGLVEQKLNNLFSNDITVNIGHIEGGVFRNIVSDDVTISHPKLKLPFSLRRIEVPYRIWYSIANKYKSIFGKDEEGLKVFFAKDNPFIDGYFVFQGAKGHLDVLGCFSLLGKKVDNILRGTISHVKDTSYSVDLKFNTNVAIKGIFDIGNETLSLNVSTDRGNVKVDIAFPDENTTEITVRLDHIDLNGIDLIGTIKLSVRDDGNKEIFDVSASGLIVNYTPLNKVVEIKGEIIEDEHTLNIPSILVKNAGDAGVAGGNVVEGFIKLIFGKERQIESNIVIKDLKLEDIVLMKYDEKIASGVLNSEVKIHGSIENPKTYLHIVIQNGEMNNFKFRALSASLRGLGSIFMIEDGRINKGDGNLIMSGEIDFSRLGEGKAFDNMLIETDQKVAVWEGWQISKWVDTSRIMAAKKLGKDDVTLTFETYANEDLFRGNQYERDNKIGVEYNLSQNENIRMELKDEENFLGLEHKVEF